MKYLIAVIIAIATCGCASELRVYNHEDKQDPDCYNHYGATPGYCDAVFQRMRDHK